MMISTAPPSKAGNRPSVEEIVTLGDLEQLRSERYKYLWGATDRHNWQRRIMRAHMKGVDE